MQVGAARPVLLMAGCTGLAVGERGHSHETTYFQVELGRCHLLCARQRTPGVGGTFGIPQNTRQPSATY